MQIEVGKIYEGKVTGIREFGAFVELDENTTGMVHISEVANTFVNDIKEHLQEGQTVKVKVMSLGDNGKISLSIKKALPPEPKKFNKDGGNNGRDKNFRNGNNNGKSRNNQGRQGGYNRNYTPKDLSKNPPPVYDPHENTGNTDFEDMLSKFKASSEDRFADLKKVIDNKRKSPSRRK